MNPNRTSLASRALAAVAVGVLSVTALAGCSPASGGAAASSSQVAEHLDAKAFADLVAKSGTVILDVRTPAEFATGHLDNAKNIDVEAPTFGEQVKVLPVGGSYAVYCRSGNRSKTALDQMKSLGFTTASDLTGGIGAWTAAGYKIVT